MPRVDHTLPDPAPRPAPKLYTTPPPVDRAAVSAIRAEIAGIREEIARMGGEIARLDAAVTRLLYGSDLPF